MANNKTESRTQRDRTKTMRVELEDWLYIDRLAGEGTPLRKAVSELVKIHKEYGDMETVDLEGLSPNE